MLKVAGAQCGHRAAALQPPLSRVFLFAAGPLVNNSRELSGGHVDRSGTLSPSSTALFLTSPLLCARLRNSCPSFYASCDPAPIIVCLHAAARGICDFCRTSDSCSRASFCTFSLLLDALFPLRSSVTCTTPGDILLMGFIQFAPVIKVPRPI